MTAQFQYLPSKFASNDTENQQHDKNRAVFIINALVFIQDYFKEDTSPFKTGKPEAPAYLNKQNKELWMQWIESWKVLKIRRTLVSISLTIFNLSDTTKTVYQHLLAPTDFSWDSFEQFGELMQPKEGTSLTVKIHTATQNAGKHLIAEYKAIETIVEASLATIIKDDLPRLKLLFSYIQKILAKEIQPKDNFSAITFTAIPTLVTRSVDTATLIQLSRYSSSHIEMQDDQIITSAANEATKSNGTKTVSIEALNAKTSRKVELKTLMSRHAALRRLMMVVNHMTQLSHNSKAAVATLNWQVFSTISEIISNPHIAGNRQKILDLLEDGQLLENLLIADMENFSQCIGQLINARDTTLPQFSHKQPNPDKFWQDISSSVTKLIPINSAVTLEHAEKYVNSLQTKSYPLNTIRHIDAAITALENIKQFMLNNKSVKANLEFKNLQAWAKSNNSNLVSELYIQLVINPEFNDALEFNALQLLQHLDAISREPVVKGHQFIDKNHDAQTMQTLKNWLDQGSHFQDIARNPASRDYAGLQGRQKVVGQIMVTLVYMLLPECC